MSTKQAIADRLYTAGMPDPDLLIRTAGEMRISNFLLVADQLCRDLGDRTLLAGIRGSRSARGHPRFRPRDRRFGGLTEEK